MRCASGHPESAYRGERGRWAEISLLKTPDRETSKTTESCDGHE